MAEYASPNWLNPGAKPTWGRAPAAKVPTAEQQRIKALTTRQPAGTITPGLAPAMRFNPFVGYGSSWGYMPTAPSAAVQAKARKARAREYASELGFLGQALQGSTQMAMAPWQAMPSMYGSALQSTAAQNLAQMQHQARGGYLQAILQAIQPMLQQGAMPGGIATDYGAGIF